MHRSSWKRRLIRLAGFVIFLFLALLLVAGLALIPFKKEAERYDLAEVRRPGAVDLNRLPPHVIDAVVATEDARFFRHGGLDLWGIGRAALVNFRSGAPRQGASTITQQLARQTYGILEKTLKRKLVEAFLARRIEKRFDKKTILSNYLSLIYFGHGFSGVEEAARGFFNKRVEDLDIAEAATLAGVIKAPSLLEPIDHPQRALTARNNVLQRMVAENMLEPAEAARLRAQPMTTRPPGNVSAAR